MSVRGLVLGLFVGSLAAGSCSAGDDTTDDRVDSQVCDDPALTWEGFAQPFLATWCTSCHGSDLVGDTRHGAPPTLNFDTLASTLPYIALIQAAAVDARRMPPTDAIAESARERLGDWIACGAPGTDVAPPPLNFCDAPLFHEGDVVASAPPSGPCVEWNAVTGNVTVDEVAPWLGCLCEVSGDVEVTAAGEVVFPEFVTVGGDFLVVEAQSITALEAPFLAVVSGDLFVMDDPLLTSLDLFRIVTVGGGLVVADDPALVNVASMAALDTVGGSLQFVDLDGLVYLDAAPKALALDGRLHVIGNSHLETLWIAESLAEHDLEIVVSDNPVLTSIVGLGELTEAGILGFNQLPALVALPDMHSLSKSGPLSVSGTGSLQTLSGLETLQIVTGSLTIDGNLALDDVSALWGIDTITGDLIVTNNPQLSEDDVDELLDRIGSNVEGEIAEWGNDDDDDD